MLPYLFPSFNELQKVLPSLIEAIFPLCDSSRVAVSCCYQRVCDAVDRCHSLGARHVRVLCELVEPLPQQLEQ